VPPIDLAQPIISGLALCSFLEFALRHESMISRGSRCILSCLKDQPAYSGLPSESSSSVINRIICQIQLPGAGVAEKVREGGFPGFHWEFDRFDWAEEEVFHRQQTVKIMMLFWRLRERCGSFSWLEFRYRSRTTQGIKAGWKVSCVSSLPASFPATFRTGRVSKFLNVIDQGPRILLRVNDV